VNREPWATAFPAQRLTAHRCLPFPDLLVALNEEATHRGLVTGAGRELRFVPQDQLPRGVAYESWIAETGCVPMRDNAHDRYSALIWMSYPHTKAALNQRQADAIAVRGVSGSRGAVRDAATLWDENLLVLVADSHADELVSCLGSRKWSQLFVDHRNRWHDIWHPAVFGHALLEKLDRPFKAITAHGLIVTSLRGDWTDLDRSLAARILPGCEFPSFYPVPVFGIPGWHPENGAPDFYSDTSVFRPAVC
jgi:hypothetical protein